MQKLNAYNSMKWKVPYIDLSSHFKSIEHEVMKEIERVMSEGSFILRDDVRVFEEKMASFLNVKHVIGVNSGTDALFLALKAAGISNGDEVITVANTFVATIATIVHCGAKPVLVDIRDDFNIDVDLIEDAITKNTKAIIPVHLNGRLCEMDKLIHIANEYNFIVIEDSCQSLGGRYMNKMAGSFGLMGCFSLHPMKILSCAGDGGYIATNDEEMANRIFLLRNHGQKTKADIVLYGCNSRLDNLQAAIVNLKFKYLHNWISRRRQIALMYHKGLVKTPLYLPQPPTNGDYYDVYNSYVVRTQKQAELVSYLREKGIEVFVHTPKPLYMHKGLGLKNYNLKVNESICNENLSIPIDPEMTDDQVKYIIKNIREFFKDTK